MYKLSQLVSTFSFIWIAGFFWRYFIQFPDNSQGLLYISIGFIGLAFAYLYSWMKDKDNEMEGLEKRIEGIIKIYTKREFAR